MRFDAHELARLQIERCRWCRLPLGYDSDLPRKQGTAPEWMERVVEPLHRRPHAVSGLADVVVHGIDQATEDPPEAHVPRRVVFPILANVPPSEVHRRIRQASGLADVRRGSAVRVGYVRAIPDVRFGTPRGRRAADISGAGLDAWASISR